MSTSARLCKEKDQFIHSFKARLASQDKEFTALTQTGLDLQRVLWQQDYCGAADVWIPIQGVGPAMLIRALAPIYRSEEPSSYSVTTTETLIPANGCAEMEYLTSAMSEAEMVGMEDLEFFC